MIFELNGKEWLRTFQKFMWEDISVNEWMTYVIKIYQTECRIYSVCSSTTNSKSARDGINSSKTTSGLQNITHLCPSIVNLLISNYLSSPNQVSFQSRISLMTQLTSLLLMRWLELSLPQLLLSLQSTITSLVIIFSSRWIHCCFTHWKTQIHLWFDW